MEKKSRNYWKIKENVINESKKYNNLNDFRKHSQSSYNSARKNNWIKEMIWLKRKDGKHQKGYWKNKNNIIKEAKKYTTKEEFKKNNLTAYLSAYKYGYMDDLHWLVKEKQHKNGYWNYQHIEEEALKYHTKTEFFKNNQTAYRAALKLGIINDFFDLNDYVEE